MPSRAARARLDAACAVVASLLLGGCGMCAGSSAQSHETLTLHLAPEHDVAMPETLTVCQDTACGSATLPSLPAGGGEATFTFSSSEASGSLSLDAGGVRRLEIHWPLVSAAFDPKDPQNTYDVKVVDKNGVETGALHVVIAYTHIPPSTCGGDAWVGSASD